MADLDPIILGHNAFFGVNHLSAEKGAATEMKFSEIKNVLSLVEFSMSRGVDALMLSTHPRARQICDEFAASSQFRDRIALYPVLPYIAKYVRMANEKGLTNVVLDSLADAPLSKKIGTIFKGGTGLLGKDMMKMIETLIDMELMIFGKLKLKVVFLHQALTDLCLGMDLGDIFRFYEEYIPRQFGAQAGYCTYNLPLLQRRLKTYGIANPVVMASFNKAGFQMNPDRATNEAALSEGACRFVAMGTLAGGYLKPKEAYEYLFKFPVVSVVAGASTEAHIDETFGLIRDSRPRP